MEKGIKGHVIKWGRSFENNSFRTRLRHFQHLAKQHESILILNLSSSSWGKLIYNWCVFTSRQNIISTLRKDAVIGSLQRGKLRGPIRDSDNLWCKASGTEIHFLKTLSILRDGVLISDDSSPRAMTLWIICRPAASHRSDYYTRLNTEKPRIVYLLFRMIEGKQHYWTAIWKGYGVSCRASNLISGELNRYSDGLEAGIRFLAEIRDFFYSTAFGSDLGFTQPPIQWTPWLFPRR